MEKEPSEGKSVLRIHSLDLWEIDCAWAEEGGVWIYPSGFLNIGLLNSAVEDKEEEEEILQWERQNLLFSSLVKTSHIIWAKFCYCTHTQSMISVGARQTNNSNQRVWPLSCNPVGILVYCWKQCCINDARVSLGHFRFTLAEFHDGIGKNCACLGHIWCITL